LEGTSVGHLGCLPSPSVSISSEVLVQAARAVSPFAYCGLLRPPPVIAQQREPRFLLLWFICPYSTSAFGQETRASNSIFHPAWVILWRCGE